MLCSNLLSCNTINVSVPDVLSGEVAFSGGCGHTNSVGSRTVTWMRSENHERLSRGAKPNRYMFGIEHYAVQQDLVQVNDGILICSKNSHRCS